MCSQRSFEVSATRICTHPPGPLYVLSDAQKKYIAGVERDRKFKVLSTGIPYITRLTRLGNGAAYYSAQGCLMVYDAKFISIVDKLGKVTIICKDTPDCQPAHDASSDIMYGAGLGDINPVILLAERPAQLSGDRAVGGPEAVSEYIYYVPELVHRYPNISSEFVLNVNPEVLVPHLDDVLSHRHWSAVNVVIGSPLYLKMCPKIAETYDKLLPLIFAALVRENRALDIAIPKREASASRLAKFNSSLEAHFHRDTLRNIHLYGAISGTYLLGNYWMPTTFPIQTDIDIYVLKSHFKAYFTECHLATPIPGGLSRHNPERLWAMYDFEKESMVNTYISGKSGIEVRFIVLDDKIAPSEGKRAAQILGWIRDNSEMDILRTAWQKGVIHSMNDDMHGRLATIIIPEDTGKYRGMLVRVVKYHMCGIKFPGLEAFLDRIKRHIMDPMTFDYSWQ